VTRYDLAFMLISARRTDGGKRMLGALGVPDPARGFLFDLDGVLTQTAKQRAAAWKLMFDESGCAELRGRS
jgi:hypothetical protein